MGGNGFGNLSFPILGWDVGHRLRFELYQNCNPTLNHASLSWLTWCRGPPPPAAARSPGSRGRPRSAARGLHRRAAPSGASSAWRRHGTSPDATGIWTRCTRSTPLSLCGWGRKREKNEILVRRRMKVVLNRVLISLMREVLKGWLFKCIIINRRLSSVQSLFTYSL